MKTVGDAEYNKSPGDFCLWVNSIYILVFSSFHCGTTFDDSAVSHSENESFRHQALLCKSLLGVSSKLLGASKPIIKPNRDGGK